MTFSPDTYKYWSREYPMFFQWAIQRDILFLPTDIGKEKDEVYDLTSKAYLLMKRLHQNYNTILLMDAEERDRLFDMELEVIKQEQKKPET